MIWVFLICVAVLVVGAIGALVTARIGYDPLSDPVESQRDPGLPDHFAASDVRALRFDTALRGYRMDQVDRVLDRLEARLAEQETELQRLRGARQGPLPSEHAADDAR